MSQRREKSTLGIGTSNMFVGSSPIIHEDFNGDGTVSLIDAIFGLHVVTGITPSV